MNFKIKDVGGSAVSTFSFSITECLGTTYFVALAANKGDLTSGVFAIAAAWFIVLAVWVVWFFRMFLGDKKVTGMPERPSMVSNIINVVLLVIWCVVASFPKLCFPVWIIAAWGLFAASLIYYLVYCRRHGYFRSKDRV